MLRAPRTQTCPGSGERQGSLESRGVMREVRPNKESRNGMKEAAGLGEAKISVNMICG